MATKHSAVPDFSHFAAGVENDETPVAVEIVNRTGDVLVGKNGKAATLHVLGEYAKQVQQAERRITDKTLSDLRKGVRFSADDSEATHLTRLTAAIVGWENVETPDGTPIPFNETNVKALLRQVPWMSDEVQKVIKAHDRFFDRSSAS